MIFRAKIAVRGKEYWVGTAKEAYKNMNLPHYTCRILSEDEKYADRFGVNCFVEEGYDNASFFEGVDYVKFYDEENPIIYKYEWNPIKLKLGIKEFYLKEKISNNKLSWSNLKVLQREAER